MLDTSSIYRDFLLLIPSRYLSIYQDFVLDRSSIPSQSIELRYIYIYIYMRSDPILLHFKYFDLSLFSLDPNFFFSPKSFLPSRFWPNPSFFHFVSALNLFFFSIFMHFMHLDLGFQVFGKNLGGFVLLSKILGWVLLIWSHMLMHCILCSL